LLEREELLDMIERDASQEIVCDFCGKDYQIAASDMTPLLDAERATR